MARETLRFLSQNTHMIGDDRRGGRPQQWAGYIGGNFDIACLQEIWTDRPVRRLLDSLNPRPDAHDRNGRTMFRSAGLTTLVWDHRITRKKSLRYNRQAGWDRWANKGAILTEVALAAEPAVLQIYNTHLNAARKRPRLSYQEERLVAVRQCFELAKFIVETRRPEAPALVCGDLNLDGENDTLFSIGSILGGSGDGARRGLNDRFWRSVPRGQGAVLRRSLTNQVPATFSTRGRFGPGVDSKTQYQLLVDLFRVLGFTDAWGETNRDRCYTTKLGRRDSDSENDFRIRLPILATPDPSSSNLFARDSRLYAPNAKRLDYLFVSPGDGTGPCTMNTAPVRRTYIPRPGQRRGLRAHQLKWLSDHVGLACTLVFD